MDDSVFNELKRRNTLREMKKEKDIKAANEKKNGKRRASARLDSPRLPRPSLGMISHKKSLITVFGHRLIRIKSEILSENSEIF